MYVKFGSFCTYNDVDIRVEFEFFAKWRRANGERQNFDDKASVAIKGNNFLNGQ